MIYKDRTRKFEIALNKDEYRLMQYLVKAHWMANLADATDGDNVNQLSHELVSKVCCPIERAMKAIIKDENTYRDWINSGFDYGALAVRNTEDLIKEDQEEYDASDERIVPYHPLYLDNNQ